MIHSTRVDHLFSVLLWFDPSFLPHSSQLIVAVKTLRNSVSRQTDTLTDFLQEVTTMQSLDHPNIIRLYGVVLTQPLKMVKRSLFFRFRIVWEPECPGIFMFFR